MSPISIFATVAILHFDKRHLRREFERKDFTYLAYQVKKFGYW